MADCLRVINHKLTPIVTTAWSPKQNDNVIIKKLPLSPSSHLEAEILRCLDHPGIPKLIETFVEDDHFYIVMECCKGRTLADAAAIKPFTELEIVDIMRQLIRILVYLHDTKRIVHRDIKPENIIIDEHNIVSLIDFGFADYINDNMTKRMGSPAYCAPELVAGAPYTELVDVWSLGIVCYWLVTGYLPFYGETVDEVFRSICCREPMVPIGQTGRISPKCSAFMTYILCKDPKSRPTIREVSEHEWIASTTLASMHKTKVSISLGIVQSLHKKRRSMVVRPHITTSLVIPSFC